MLKEIRIFILKRAARRHYRAWKKISTNYRMDDTLLDTAARAERHIQSFWRCADKLQSINPTIQPEGVI